MYLKTASIKLRSDLDVADFDSVRTALAPAERADEAVVDFTELAFISATVLGCLVAVVNSMVAHNRLGVVRIVGANDRIMKVFRLCNAETLFDFSDTTWHGASAIAERLSLN